MDIGPKLAKLNEGMEKHWVKNWMDSYENDSTQIVLFTACLYAGLLPLW